MLGVADGRAGDASIVVCVRPRRFNLDRLGELCFRLERLAPLERRDSVVEDRGSWRGRSALCDWRERRDPIPRFRRLGCGRREREEAAVLLGSVGAGARGLVRTRELVRKI